MILFKITLYYVEKKYMIFCQYVSQNNNSFAAGSFAESESEASEDSDDNGDKDTKPSTGRTVISGLCGV
jgi:hypothetical protein